MLGGREVEDDERYVHDRSIVVVEVLSIASVCQRISPLEHYLVVHPFERFVLIHSAGPERDWSIVRAAREDFALDPPDVVIPFAPIFARLRDGRAPGCGIPLRASLPGASI